MAGGTSEECLPLMVETQGTVETQILGTQRVLQLALPRATGPALQPAPLLFGGGFDRS
jgi:hypothetical protein